MHAACQLCKGACCEGVRLPVHLTQNADIDRWLGFHGTREDLHVYYRCPCCKLKDGLCTVYASRPDICRDAPVGDADCLRAIQRNRPDQAGAIIKLLG